MVRLFNVDSIISELRLLGVEATHGHDPTDLWLDVHDERGGGSVVLACDFNVSGWEAAWNPPPEVGVDQEPLHAWLSGDADAVQVALWAAALAYDPRRCLDSESRKLPA